MSAPRNARAASDHQVMVYGGGVAALGCALELAARGCAVDLIGPTAPERWPCLSAGGINTGRDPERLYRETIACGGYLAPRAPVRAMAVAAAELVRWLTAIGVPFARDEAGELALRRLAGASAADAAFVDGQTAAQITHALAGQVGPWSRPADTEPTPGTIRRRGPAALVALVRDDDGRCTGTVVQDLVTMEMEALPADAVVLAVAGPERMFGSPSGLCPESATAVALQAGAVFANADLVQLHPATLTVGERLYPLSSAIVAESGRFWVPRETEERRRPRDVPKPQRDFFLQSAHPGVGDQIPADLAARAVARVCWAEQRGIYDPQEDTHRPLVFLDISHLPEATLAARLGAEATACGLLTGTELSAGPLAVAAGATLSLGGLWVDHAVNDDGALDDDSPRNHSTSIPGLYAASGAGSLYHGCCRLGGNGLLADLFGARLTARAVLAHGRQSGRADPDEAALDAAVSEAAEGYAALLDRADDEAGRTPAELAARLRAAMSKLLLTEPAAERVALAREAVDKLAAQAARACPDDWCGHANRGAPVLRELEHMLALAEVVVASAAARLDDGSDEPQTVLVRRGDEGVATLQRFVRSVDGQAVTIGRTIAPGDLPPAPRRYAEEESP